MSSFHRRDRRRRRSTVRPGGGRPSPPSRAGPPHLRHPDGELAGEHAAGVVLQSDGSASGLSDPSGSYPLEAHCCQHGLPYGDYGVPSRWRPFRSTVRRSSSGSCPRWRTPGWWGSIWSRTAMSCERRRRGAQGEERRPRRGISHFAHVPEHLARLPRELASHTPHHRALGGFAGREVTVVGGGESALETAALALEQSATVRVLVPQPRLVWNPAPDQVPRPLARRLRYPMIGLGPGCRSYCYCNAPVVFHLDRLPFLSDRLRVGSTGSGERQRCRPPSRRRRRACTSSAWPRPTARGR